MKVAETTLDYNYQDISGHTFLLPYTARVLMAAEGYLTRNDDRVSALSQVPGGIRAEVRRRNPAARCPKTRRKSSRRRSSGPREEEVAARELETAFSYLQFRNFANIMKPSGQNEGRPVPGGRWIMPSPGLVRRIAREGAGQ